MKIKFKIPLIILIVTALIMSIISGYIKYTTNVAIVEQGKFKAMHDINDLIQSDMKEQQGRAAARASLIANQPQIQKALRAQDRDELVRQLLPTYLLQQEKYGVTEGSFWLPPAIAFLRLQDLTHFGEDVSSYLQIIVETIKQQKPFYGVDLGRHGINIRGTDVVKDEKGVIGCFIIGMGFGAILDNIKNDTGCEAGIFGDEAMLNKISVMAVKPDEERIVGGYRLLEVTNWKKIRPVVKSDLVADVQEVSYKIQTVAGVDYGVVIVPIKNFMQQKIGLIVATKNFKNYQSLLKSCFVSSVAFALLQFVVQTGIILILYNALMIRPIQHLSENILHLSEGKTDVDIEVLSHRNDEVGDLVRNVEQIKKNLKEASTKAENGGQTSVNIESSVNKNPTSKSE